MPIVRYYARIMCQPGSISASPRTLSPAFAVGALLTGFLGMALATGAVGDWPLRTVLAVGETVLAIPTIIAILVARLRWTDAALGVRPPARAWALGLAIAIPLWMASLGLMELQFALWPPDPEYLAAFRRLYATLSPTGPWDTAMSILAIAVLPAAAEELVCRGALFASLMQRYGSLIAVLGSSLLFAAVHADPYRTPFALGVGIVLGLVRLRTGSIGPGIAAHALINSFTFLVAPLVDDPLDSAPQSDLGLGILMLAGGAFVLWLLLRRRGSRVSD